MLLPPLRPSIVALVTVIVTLADGSSAGPVSDPVTEPVAVPSVVNVIAQPASGDVAARVDQVDPLRVTTTGTLPSRMLDPEVPHRDGIVPLLDPPPLTLRV